MRARWRATEPGRPVAAWTKVHELTENGERTECGLPVPLTPYTEDRGDEVPESAPRCKRCARKAGR